MSSSDPVERSCSYCKKQPSELSTPLKQCAKCHTQYCSRECQKDDWKDHKKQCSSNQAQTAPSTSSLSNANPDIILESAQDTVNLMKALSHDPNFKIDLRTIPQSAAGLKYIADFVGRTFREYTPALLPPQKFAELSADLESFHGLERESQLRGMGQKFEEIKSRDSSFDKDAWPRLDKDKYSDSISRNIMAAKIILTPSRQSMMGGTYSYSDEVKTVCRRITNDGT